MKIVKISSIFYIIALFIYILFHPLPQGPYGYSIFLISWLVVTIEVLWPRFDAFLGALPLAARLLFPILCALLAFMDVKTRGLTLYGLSFYFFAVFPTVKILSLKRR
jgi:hypothetical protein